MKLNKSVFTMNLSLLMTTAEQTDIRQRNRQQMDLNTNPALTTFLYDSTAIELMCNFRVCGSSCCQFFSKLL